MVSIYRNWEPLETTSDSEPEAQPAAEKGSIEKTEKVTLSIPPVPYFNVHPPVGFSSATSNYTDIVTNYDAGPIFFLMCRVPYVFV